MSFKLKILGCYASTPRSLTNPTAQVLELNRELFLIDCGEGTQKEMRLAKVNFMRLSRVFISHLHGDHFYGLPGLVTTMGLMGRTEPFTIYGPKGIKEVLTTILKSSSSCTNYPLHFVELDQPNSELIYVSSSVRVHTLPLKHRIYTNGFLFETVQSDQIVKRYAYCSDTAYDETLAPLISGTQVLYHDSTFLETERHLCEKTGHSTAFQAAQLAKISEIKILILGHYSTRYTSIDLFREEAAKVLDMERIELAEDQKLFEFN